MLLALFVAGVGGLYLMVRGYAQQTADTAYDQLLRASALSIADSLQLVDDMAHGHAYAALALLEQAPRDRVFYQVRAGDGALVSGYPDLPARPWMARPTTRPHRGCSRRATRASRCASPGWAQDRRSRRHAQHSRVLVGQTSEARDALAARVLWRGTLALLGFTAAALALAWWGLRRSLAPIRRIERELAARGASDLQPIKAPVPEELDTLVHTLDGFMARLAENLDTLRLFIAEAAHQLRTPLAALHAQMEVALDEEDPPNNAAACWPCCATPRNCRGWSTSCSATPA